MNINTDIISKTFEQWIIYGLFVLLVILFIRKWIPFLVEEFKKIREDFLTALEDQHNTFERTLDSQQKTFERTLKVISDDFIKRVEKSESWHRNHSEELKEIKKIINTK